VAETPPKTITDGGKAFTYLTFTSTGQCTAGKINVTRFVYVDAMLEVE
jgi:MSHA biogenesis protein MshP